MLFLVLYRVFKNLEPLSFDSPSQTDVFRRSTMTAKVFVSRTAQGASVVEWLEPEFAVQEFTVRFPTEVNTKPLRM